MRSQQIGRDHENKVETLLWKAQLPFCRNKRIRTLHGTNLTLDFWLPSTNGRGPVVLECKTFGVEAKSTADSRRRKVQEALWLLIQLRRYCAETEGARIILITGKEPFLNEQKQLLADEIGPDFHIVSIEEHEGLHSLLV